MFRFLENLRSWFGGKPQPEVRNVGRSEAVLEAVTVLTPEPTPEPVKRSEPARKIEPLPAPKWEPAPSEPVKTEPATTRTLESKLAAKISRDPVFTGHVEIAGTLDNPVNLRQFTGVISVSDMANRELLDLVPYEPGKPVDDVARELGLDPASIIKLASNENPLGPSPMAVAAMRQALDSAHFYPDGGGFHLRNAIAKTFGLGRENVVLGNGSNEIIELLFHTFTRPGIHEIVTARHAFAVYTLMAQLFGVHAIVVDDVDFTPDLSAMLRAITPQTRLIFLASPNNPTGTRVTNEALDAFLRELPPHVIAVLDEAYYEFLDHPPDTVGQVRDGARVVLMRTFSKIQGLAGLRIGYGLAPAEIANLLQRARQPFNANSIAQAGAMAGLADTEHQRRTKSIIDEGRRVIEDAFARMGLRYVPSSANFVLVHVGDGGEVFKRLMKKGIIVRSMVSYHLPEYIRVSIGTPEQNARFLTELPAALDGLISFKPLSVETPAALRP
jgi:histidinol-phosphate aminotransferase